MNAESWQAGWAARAGRRLVAAAAAMVMCSASPGSAAVLFRDDLGAANPLREVIGGRIVETSQGKGWQSTTPAWPHAGEPKFVSSDRVTYAIDSKLIPYREGAIELMLVNNEKDDNAFEPDTVFELSSSKEMRSVFTVTVNWNGEAGTVLGFDGREFQSDQYSREIVIPRIAKGGKLHLMLRWDDASLLRSVEANGKVFNVKMPRVAAGANRTKVGDRREIASLLKKADTLRLGVLTDRREFWPQGEMPNNDTVVIAFALHDNADAGLVLTQPAITQASVSAVSHDAVKVAGFSGKLVAGNVLTVTANGTPSVAGGFDIARIADESGRIVLDWRGVGVYLEEKTFYETDEINLRDVAEYRVYLSKTPFSAITADMEPVKSLKVDEQIFMSEVLENDTPYYAAVTAVMKDQTVRSIISPLVNLPVTEAAPGLYQGSYRIGYSDRYPKAQVIAHLGSGAGAAYLGAQNTFGIDPALNIAVTATPDVLHADEKATSEISVTVTDANGNPVPGHKVKFHLATTSQYTGVVGGGAFADQVGGAISENAWGETDLFGKLTTVYRAGFAAKTAIIVARDMVSNDTGAGWVKTYITATAELELEPVAATAAMQQGYQITVTSSDEWLTADGKSTARITANVTQNGLPVEGHLVDFNVSAGTGTIRTVKNITDKNGDARAVYTAGTKIGIVLITATDTTVGISGSVQIELRSDAPAKIAIRIKPEKIPADGRSTADIQVLVTDINDNPNDNTEVEYRVVRGGGSLQEDRTMTDRNGESTNLYRAGREAGKVTLELTVRSTVPVEEELIAARNLAVAVTDYDFF